MSDRDPRILPGASARSLRRFAHAVLVFTVVDELICVGTAGSLRAFAHRNPVPPALNVLLWVLVVLAGLFVVMSITGVAAAYWAWRKKLRELAAGYTTVFERFNQVDGIDAKRGIVVRPAVTGSHDLNPAGHISSGAELGSITGIPAPARVLARTPAIFYAFLASVALSVGVAFAIFIVVSAFLSVEDAVRPSVVVGLFLLAAAFLVPAITWRIFPPLAYAQILASRFAGAEVQSGRVVDPDALAEFRDSGDAVLDHADCRVVNFFVFDREHLVIYSRFRTELIPFLCIPRQQVTGVVTPSSGEGATVRLNVQKNNGTATALALSFDDADRRAARPEFQTSLASIESWRTTRR